MRTLLLLVIIQAAVFTGHAQEKIIGRFSNANSFYINQTGFIYVSDINENKVYKLDTLGNKIKETGGFGWGEAAFDAPADIFATPLNVYVTDKNNHRIQWFDKDLNFISMLHTRDRSNDAVRFGYPLSAAVSGQGDLFILDQENNRMLKFDLFGNFLLEFGGLDAGRFRINKPVEFALLNNTTFLLDNRGKRVLVFDQFGSGLNIITLDQSMDNITASDGGIILSNESEVFYLDIGTGQAVMDDLPDVIEEPIKDVFIFHKDLYILTPTRIFIFR